MHYLTSFISIWFVPSGGIISMNVTIEQSQSDFTISCVCIDITKIENFKKLANYKMSFTFCNNKNWLLKSFMFIYSVACAIWGFFATNSFDINIVCENFRRNFDRKTWNLFDSANSSKSIHLDSWDRLREEVCVCNERAIYIKKKRKKN